MLSFNPEKIDCSGCAACYSACPKHCITMVKDEEGFDYPVLTSPEACIGCNLCETVCPAIKTVNRELSNQKAFATVSKDFNIWHRSASGGAFSEICRAWGDGNTLVVGAAWKGLYVHHIGVVGVENISPLCKSKYVSSHIEDTFREIKDYLAHGKVIFCGTPCQVSGLRSFLRKDFENLLTIDLICHGVGSPSVFEACANAISKQENKPLKEYTFRAKRRAHEVDHLTLLTFFDGSKKYVCDDQYMQLFLKQTCLRPSCGKNCKYRGRNKRPGDFTIADFKGLTEIFPDLIGTKMNYSTIVANTEKASAVLDVLGNNMEIRPVQIEDVVRYNPLFDKHTWFSESRDAFFEDFIEDRNHAIMKWTHPYIESKRSIKRLIFDICSSRVRKLLLRLVD